MNVETPEGWGFRWQDWRRRAACHFADPKLFTSPVKQDLPDGVSLQKERERRTGEAKAVCRVCPVRWPCLQDALANPAESPGVRGGYTALERKEIEE